VPLVRVCDYVYCLNFGQLLAEGLPDDVRNHPLVVTASLGEDAEVPELQAVESQIESLLDTE
jgi:branched-chain amino acid transport system ATP-binding protein